MDTGNETILNSIFFHFTDMRISTHIRSFLRFKLKLAILVTYYLFNLIFFHLALIFLLLFYVTEHYPLAIGFKWGGGFMWGGGGAFRWEG